MNEVMTDEFIGAPGCTRLRTGVASPTSSRRAWKRPSSKSTGYTSTDENPCKLAVLVAAGDWHCRASLPPAGPLNEGALK